ncbi:MAG: FGGY family carbohydrate kinase [Pseudolysinimonas sp.]|uniref:xylulokinase n=1 Tax=Pseudolysinimonas sp. TaxID=2680009 RepID=UPI003C74D7FB
MSDSILGIDAGTSACKTVLLSLDGAALGSSTRTYPTTRGSDGSATQSPGDWVDAMVGTVREVLSLSDSPKLIGISVTAPAHNVVLTHRDGREPSTVLLWSDRRPARHVQPLLDAHADYFDRTLVRLSSGWSLPQLRWIRHTEPDRWEACEWVLPAKDYLRFVLTGVAATDPSDAAGTGLFDPAVRDWWSEIVDAEDLSGRLPPILSSSDIGGHLLPDVAVALGVPAGIPVAVGATDTAAELVSIGARRSGTGLIKIASTGTVVAVTDRLASDPRLLIYPHADEGLWYVLAATNSAATAHAWIARQLVGLGEFSELPLSELVHLVEESAASVPPGSGGAMFLPFLDGERTPYWDHELRAAFLGLTGYHGPGHLARAVMEGVAMSLRTGLGVIRDLGHDLTVPVLTGGGLESGLWRSILVAALDLDATRMPRQGPAIGAAMIAGRLVGADIMPYVEALPVERPAPAWTQCYDDLFAIYTRAVEATAPLSHALGRFGAPSGD